MRFLRWIFRRMALTCTFTVASEIPHCRAMNLLDLPWLRHLITSTSRPERILRGSANVLLFVRIQEFFTVEQLQGLRWEYMLALGDQLQVFD